MDAELEYLKRFIERLRVDVETGCWVWSGAVKENGYGAFSRGSTRTTAHRFAAEYFNGAIPVGHTVDHLCRNRRCCNPNHLEAVPHRENVARKPSTRPTKCSRGHPMAGENLYVDPKGFWKCRTCKAGRRGPRINMTKQEQAMVSWRVANGESPRAIALELGRHYRSIQRIARTVRPEPPRRLPIPRPNSDMRGVKNPNALLAEADVAKIVSMIREGFNNTQISAHVSVGHSLVSRIRTGRSWQREAARLGWEPAVKWVADNDPELFARLQEIAA